MAYNDIKSVKETNVIGHDYIECEENEATHWLIEFGFDGKCGFAVLPSQQSAKACFDSFVIPYERGLI